MRAATERLCFGLWAMAHDGHDSDGDARVGANHDPTNSGTCHPNNGQTSHRPRCHTGGLHATRLPHF